MRRAAIIFVLSVVLGLASACGGDDDGGTGAPATTTSETAAQTSIPEAAPTTSPAAPDLAAVRVTLTEVAAGLDSPTAMAVRTGDDRFYVTEQAGRVRIVDGGQVVGDPVLEVDVSDGNEQGLLGVAFSPDGTKLYIDYTDPTGNTHVDEYTMDGDVAEASSQREILTVEQPYANHNGGQVLFGPDEMLYVTLGDGGAGGDPEQRAQNLGELLGKILRIDPTPSADAPYTIPADNPFVEQDGARPEIWMYGLRNPWRFSFDRATEDVWIGDVGQNAWEEIDYASAADASGSNWGWNPREGAHDFEGPAPAGARDPIFELSHNDGNCSVTGGYVYRGQQIPALQGAYVFADFCRGELIGLVQQNGALAAQQSLGVSGDSVTSFGEDAAGELYVVSRAGTILRLDPA